MIINARHRAYHCLDESSCRFASAEGFICHSDNDLQNLYTGKKERKKDKFDVVMLLFEKSAFSFSSADECDISPSLAAWMNTRSFEM